MAEKPRQSRSLSLAAVRSQSKGVLKEKSFSKMKFRRQSYGFGRVPGVMATGRRSSQLGLEFRRPVLMYLPSYQLNPPRKVNEAAVRKVINDLLDDDFTGHKYNVQESPALALRLSGEIMREMKGMDYSRYRFIVVVSIFQRRAQCYNNAISFLWDHERDTYADVQRENNFTYIHVTAFAIYLD